MQNFKSIILITLFFVAGNTAIAQEHKHEGHLSILLEHYLNAKDALTSDNFEDAHSSIIEFRKEVVDNDEMNRHEEHAKMHTKHHAAMVEAVENAYLAEDIKQLRAAFVEISDNLIQALENQGFDKSTLYFQYCPMAAGSEGARWISESEEIVNPYMGQRMSGCGSTKKTLD